MRFDKGRWRLTDEQGRVFIKIRRRRHASKTHEYVDIVESLRVDGKVVQRILATLGRREDLPPTRSTA